MTAADLGPAPAGRFGMSGEAFAVHEGLLAAISRVELANASVLGAAQGTAPADRWQHCADYIAEARGLLDTAAGWLARARPEAVADDGARREEEPRRG